MHNHAGKHYEYAPAIEDQHCSNDASLLASNSASHNVTNLEDEGKSEGQRSNTHRQCTEGIGQRATGKELLPFNVGKHHRLLGKIVVHIPPHLKNALAAAIIGHYTEIFRSADIHFSGWKADGSLGEIDSSPMSEFQQKMSNSVWLDFGHGSFQRLPLFPLAHSPTVESVDYESIIQLHMEGILLAPKARENLSALLKTQLRIPESLQLLYMSRLPSVESSEKLWTELVSECERLIPQLQTSDHPSTSNKAHRYLAQVYDAMGYLVKHKKTCDFTGKWNEKALYHQRASQERQLYQPCSDLDASLVLLEQIRSTQSEGYSHSELATNSTESAVLRKAYSESAHELHKKAINDHAKPLLKRLDMDREMSEPAALVANLRFDEMLRILRPGQLDFLLHPKWSKEDRHQKCMAQSEMIEREARRIQDLLSWRTVPAHARLWSKMETSVAKLRKEVERGSIKGFALNDPTMSE